MRYYSIGDIHGQLGMLKDAHERIAADRAACGDAVAPVVHLGDLVDRGPDSRGVIDFLMDGISRDEPWIVLKGNHDRIFETVLDVSEKPAWSFSAWTSSNMGGSETAASYGVSFGPFTMGERAREKLSAEVPDTHKSFLADLPLFYETDSHIFVHAGIRPGLPLSDQIEEDLLWIRREFHNDTRDHGKLIVHGHTPVDEAMHYGNRVNLDTGAGFGYPITVAVLEGSDVWILEELGRRPLKPQPPEPKDDFTL